MKVLFDTNVIIDAVTERYSNTKHSQRLWIKAINGDIEGYVCSNQLTDIYYVLRKYVSEEVRRKILKAISDSFTVLPLLPSYTSYCINTSMTDYEDAILDEVAKVNMIGFLVTNNEKDFKKAKSTIISPKDLDCLLSVNDNGFSY